MNTQEKQREFVALFEANRGVAYRFCNFYFDDSEERKDVFQMIAEAAWKSFSNFRFESKFSTWLHAVSRNTVISVIRKKNSSPTIVPLSKGLVDVMAEEKAIERMKERGEELNRLIGLLPEIEQNTVCLYLLGESQERIASLMDTTVGNVRVRMHRIKAFMRKRLSPDIH